MYIFRHEQITCEEGKTNKTLEKYAGTRGAEHKSGIPDPEYS
jgi:hypothetical protein